jgi:uncharacterized protein (DUF427 family)
MDLLRATDLHTSCPYKGTASYWSVVQGDRVSKNVVWGYPGPYNVAAKIEGLVCFYNEKVDLIVDGVPLDRPVTGFP